MPLKIRIQNEDSRENAVNAVLGANHNDVVTISLTLHLRSDKIRGRAVAIIRKLTPGWMVAVKKRNRSQEQNDFMWVLLTILSRAKPRGIEKTAEQWKHLALHMCKHQCQFELDLNNAPFAVGLSTSRLSVGEMSDLITWIISFGVEEGIEFPPNPNQKEPSE